MRKEKISTAASFKDCKQQGYLYYSERLYVVPILKFFKWCAWPVDVMFRYSIESKTSKMEIFNATSV